MEGGREKRGGGRKDARRQERQTVRERERGKREVGRREEEEVAKILGYKKKKQRLE